MKRLLSIVLILAFLTASLSVFVPTASAKGGTISKKEAEELVIKASEFFYDARVDGYNEHIMDHNSEDRRKVHLSEYNIDVTYLPADESKLPGGSYSAMCEIAKTIYAGEAVSNSYNFRTYYQFDGTDYNVITFPNFYIDESGKVYAGHFLEYGYISARENTLNLVSNIHGDNSEASAIITIDSYWGDGPRPDYHFPVECRFVNTDDGWRIAESEFSILFATDTNYLDDYREANPDKVNPDALKLADAEAKYTIDEIMTALSGMNHYALDYYKYTQTKGERMVSITKEVIGDNGEKKAMKYLKLVFTGGITEYDDETIEFSVTADTFKRFDRAYADADFERRIKEGGEYYVAVPNDVNFAYDLNTAVVKVIESNEKEATALVYCELLKDGKRIPISVECRFEKPYLYGRWYVADSPFVDMITSADEFEYTVAEAPKTGDNAYNTVTICLGTMALCLSALCLTRRRREII